MMDDAERILLFLKDQRSESKNQLGKLEAALSRLSEATSRLTVATTLSEERHAQQDDAQRRMGKQLDDHEARIRLMEKSVLRGEVTVSTSTKTGVQIVTLLISIVAAGAAIFALFAE